MGRQHKEKRTKPQRRRNPFLYLCGWIFQIILVMLFAYVLVYFFGQSRTNVGQSMDATISGGDKILLDELTYKFSAPKRGDIIAFKPNGSENSHSYIKRVIGLPGETIQIIDGMIYINGNVYLEEKDYPAITDAGLASEPITLSSTEYFVLGDNRNNSEDSRYADVGNVETSDIEGKVLFIISPIEHFGFVN